MDTDSKSGQRGANDATGSYENSPRNAKGARVKFAVDGKGKAKKS